MSVQGLSPGYRGAAADVEQILLRWEILGKELSKLCKSRYPCVMLRPELFFVLPDIMRTTLHQNEHILLNDPKQDCF